MSAFSIVKFFPGSVALERFIGLVIALAFAVWPRSAFAVTLISRNSELVGSDADVVVSCSPKVK